MNIQHHTKKLTLRFIFLIVAICAVAFGAVTLLWTPARVFFRVNSETLLAHTRAAPSGKFPDVSLDGLSPIQIEIIRLAEGEYNKKPVSFDVNVLKYSQREKQPWCANFASWIMKEAGAPLRNPHSGSWRIPGSSTMQEYFKSIHRYQHAGSYTPKIGDIAVYLQNRSHVNIVIKIAGNQMTTVGGNEDGHIRINNQAYAYGAEGLSGFGTVTD